MLTEHAISHAMNLNNPLLMLYSSIYYAQFERLYDTSHKVNEIGGGRSLNSVGFGAFDIKEYLMDRCIEFRNKEDLFFLRE